MGGTGGTFMPGKPLGPTFYIPLCPCTRENVCTRRYIAVYFSSFHSTTSTPAPPPSPRPLTPPPPDHPTTLLYARPTPLDHITAYHCLSLPITAYHCLSLPFTAYHCLSSTCDLQGFSIYRSLHPPRQFSQYRPLRLFHKIAQH
jgi:hypothetical protein